MQAVADGQRLVLQVRRLRNVAALVPDVSQSIVHLAILGQVIRVAENLQRALQELLSVVEAGSGTYKFKSLR